MRTLIFFLLAIGPLYCEGQMFVKSIYDPSGNFLYDVSVIKNSDSTYNIVTKNNYLTTGGLDDSGKILWTKNIVTPDVKLDGHHALCRVSDSTFIVVSTCYYEEYIFDVYLAKINNRGDALWIKSIGSTVNTEYGNGIVSTEDSGFLIAGAKWYWGVNPGRVYIVKTDSIGNIEWTKGYNRPNMDVAFDATEVKSGFVIAGATDSIGSGGSFGFLIKTDKAGKTLWTKGYGNPLSFVKSMIQDGNCFILAGGSTPEINIGDSPNGDVVLSKTDSTGNPIWTKKYHFDDASYAAKIIKTIDGGYLILGMYGHFLSINPGCFFLKTDSAGNMLWCKKYGGQSQGYVGNSVLQKSNGDLITAGEYFTTTDVLLSFKTDSLGNGTGICETSMTPIESSRTMSDSNIVFAEEFYTDSSRTVSFSVLHDTLAVIDSCNISPVDVTTTVKTGTKLYPNPTNGTITIESPLNSYDIEILNAFGNNIYLKKAEANKVNISMGQYPKGFYMCRIIKDGKVRWTEGFILQ